jgi:hypothetical protein
MVNNIEDYGLKAAGLAKVSWKVFRAADCALHYTGEPAVQVAAVQIRVNDFLNTGTKKCI